LGAPFLSASSTASDPAAAASDLCRQLGSEAPAVLVFFADSDATAIEAELRKSYPETTILGCSQTGSFARGAYLDSGVSAFAFPKGRLGRHAACLTEVNDSVKESVAACLGTIEEQLGTSLRDADSTRFVTLLFMAHGGLELGPTETVTRGIIRNREISEALGEHAPTHTFVGGSPGSLPVPPTRITVNGRSHGGPAMALLTLELESFTTFSTSAAVPTAGPFKVTRSDGQVIQELDGKPAAEVYTAALGVPLDQFDPVMAYSAPLGMMMDGEVWCNQVRVADKTLVTDISTIPQGAEVHVLKLSDVVATTRAALEKKQRELGKPFAGAILFNCDTRNTVLREAKQTGAFLECFPFPMAGTHCLGESYFGAVGYTTVGLLLG
jgi:hypothetical protein